MNDADVYIKGGNATTACVYTFISPRGNYEWTYGFEPQRRRNILNLYKVYIINAFTGSLLSEHTVIGKDQGEAALGVTLTEDEKALKAKDDLEMIWQRVGEFEKREVQRIRND